MSFVVVAKFPCKPGPVEAIGDLFRAALSDTGRGWSGDTRFRRHDGSLVRQLLLDGSCNGRHEYRGRPTRTCGG